MTNRAWFVLRDQQKQGPFSDGQMAAMIRAGRIRLNDHVWTHGMTEWRRVADTDLAERSAPSPSPNNPFDFSSSSGPSSGGKQQSASGNPFDFSAVTDSGSNSGRRKTTAQVRKRKKVSLNLGRHWWAIFVAVWGVGSGCLWAYYKFQDDREWNAYSDMMWASGTAERLGGSRFADPNEVSRAVGNLGAALGDYRDLTRNGSALTRRNRALTMWSFGVLAVAAIYFVKVVREKP